MLLNMLLCPEQLPLDNSIGIIFTVHLHKFLQKVVMAIC